MVEALVVGGVAGYLLGSIPVGLWVGRIVGGVDLRQVGSGKTGATNTLRRLGKKWSLLVFLLDGLKGVLAVLIPYLIWDSPTAEVVGGLAVIIGHIFPLFARFRGGRGATTALLVLLVLSPPLGAIGFASAILFVFATRIMSVATLATLTLMAILLTIVVALDEEPTAYYAFGWGAFTIITISHRDNIRRLLAGTEPRIGRMGRTHKLAPEGGEQQP